MRWATCFAALTLLLAGCGGEDGDESGGAAGSPVKTIRISETEFAIEPSSVSLDRPGTYAFEVVNDGEVAHALEVEGEGIEEETETLQPGDRATLTVALEDGTYELYCPIADHKDRGMVGEAAVGSTGPPVTKTTDEQDDGY